MSYDPVNIVYKYMTNPSKCVEYVFPYPQSVYLDGVEKPLCNCSYFYYSFPDIMIRTVDSKTVRIDSEVLRGSKTLQWMVVDYRDELDRKQLLKQQGQNLSAALQLDENENIMKLEALKELTLKNANSGGESTDLNDLIEFKKREVIDLTDNCLGITAETLTLIDYFMKMHLRETLESWEAKKRADAFFRKSCLPRPKPEAENKLAFAEWEEEFFESLAPSKILELTQAVNDLKILDFHRAIEKWFHLFRGRQSTDSEEDEELPLSRRKAVYNPRRRSAHLNPSKYVNHELFP